MGRLGVILFLFGLVLSVERAIPQTSSSGRITGEVKDERGQPVARAKVRAIEGRTNRTLAEAMTGEDGRFVLSDLIPGRYALLISSPDHEPAVVRSVDVKAGRETSLKSPIRLRRAEAYAVISGATFDPNGFLLPGVRVVLERLPLDEEKVPPLKLEQVSNSSGEFAFRVPGERGRYRLTATASGYEPEVQIVEVGGLERRRVALRLKARAKGR
ncbi:MAG: carboxypeptidase-like regulatory domain-containing protein [Blastocatellia bacterium]|nr:carboxypeptidase-like regulatory domain-containing protein [Blastocatellia bacterium]MDW8168498.1 carboxypeptidase-like regulatory domain-containing protein [Acidobacteriota bacterium]